MSLTPGGTFANRCSTLVVNSAHRLLQLSFISSIAVLLHAPLVGLREGRLAPLSSKIAVAVLSRAPLVGLREGRLSLYGVFSTFRYLDSRTVVSYSRRCVEIVELCSLLGLLGLLGPASGLKIWFWRAVRILWLAYILS